MFKITNILNPLTGGAETREYLWEAGKPLSEYMDYDGECVVACGGEVIDKALGSIFPARKEEYAVMPVPEGGDKQTWRVLGYAALSYFAAGFPGTPLLSTWASKIPAGSRKGLWYLGAMALNLFLQDKEKDQSTSPSYAWEHVSSPTAAYGSAMPVIYGKARVRPTIKNRYVVIEGDKQRLYALYGLAAHKVDERSVSEYIGSAGEYGDEFGVADIPGMTFINVNKDNTGAILNSDGSYNTDDWKIGHGTGGFYNDIIINGRSITDYHNDVDWETRPGLPEQAVIDGFDATYTNTAIDVLLLKDIPTVDLSGVLHYSSTTGNIRWDEHTLRYGSQVYKIRSELYGSVPPSKTIFYYLYWVPGVHTDRYEISVGTEPSGDGVYLILKFHIEPADYHFNYARPIFDYQPDKVATPTDNEWYEPVASITNTHNVQLIFEFPYGLYNVVDGKITETETQLFAQYKRTTATTWTNFDIKYPDVDVRRSNYANTTIVSGEISRKTTKPFNITLNAVDKANQLVYGTEYNIRVAANSVMDVKLVNISTIVYGEKNIDGTQPGFTYPGEPLLGIKALASGQISSDLDVQVDVERSLVWVYDGTNNYPDHPGWNKVYANNHAWAVYDILAQGHVDHPAYPSYGNDDAEAIYGCGVDKDRIDYDSFKEWADNIDALGYELNIVYDTFMSAWDAILRICQEGRAMVYPVGTTIYVFVDKPSDVVQLFTVGNIHTDSFVQKYTESKYKANMVEADYYDAERNYEKTSIAVRTANWDSDDQNNTPVKLTLYGTTAFNQAQSLARFMLRGNELLTNSIAFDVGVDALAAQVGDVVEVQHDLLASSSGGRIVSYQLVGSFCRVTLDKEVTLVQGRKYELRVWHSGVIVSKSTTYVGTTTTTAVVTFNTHFTTPPAQYDPYSFGVYGADTREYRITNISRTNELVRTLVLSQYDEDVYESYAPSDTDSDAEQGGFTSAKVAVSDDATETVANLLNLASNVRLQEIVSQNRTTGEYESSIVVVWDTVDGDPRGTWEVWFRDVDASDLDWQGEWGDDEAYGIGDKVENDGDTYISVEDNNTSQPFNT